ncbi:MAG: hypothetical protein A2586_01260 [Candidatus Harrisonbacteria bacterium RIFOXYD1_FULL_40_9]|uniref:Oxidoreductase n=1 Tax=Candidatus Harrisonbacteria bacterium RIFOXYD1_FULL_40_9 TaxID=1798412 RepID=A0A1G1ZYF8_9BACT|nr:MAG: hypothetical protein A2586_01260 [Candidatus Harrisonbacteria bacterium RIFOXYD1_FULL_40_9]
MVQVLYVFSDWALLVARLVVGIVFIAHGWPKLKNLSETAVNFTMMGFRPGKLWAIFIAFLEIFGGILMILGFFVQPLGILFMIEMIVATLFVKRRMGLVNGCEIDISLFSLALIAATMGGGALALDSYMRVFLY